MKIVTISLLSLAFLPSAFAIQFITEEQVRDTLGADKVIEISKASAEKLLSADLEDCQQALLSRSGRAYIVKTGYNSTLVVTPSGLDPLLNCGKI